LAINAEGTIVGAAEIDYGDHVDYQAVRWDQLQELRSRDQDCRHRDGQRRYREAPLH